MAEAAAAPSGGSKTLAVLAAFFAAFTAGGLLLFTAGEVTAAIVFVGVIAAAFVVAATGTARAVRIAAAVFAALGVIAIAVGVVGLVQIVSALASTEGAPDPPDPVALTAGKTKVEVAAEESGFRLELSEGELNAVLQEALQDGDNPFKSVTVDILNPVGEPGRVAFEGSFKNGGLGVEGVLAAEVEGGTLTLELVDVGIGMFSMPGIARNAVEDMITRLADFNEALAAEGATVQRIVVGDDRLVVTGTHRGAPIDASDALSSIRRQVDLRGFVVGIEPEFEPGRVDGIEAPGDRYYVALGDSLAANVGVDAARDGYVSQFHLQLERTDGVEYGLRNFGVSGETSTTMLEGGQLDAAESFARDHDVAYVTLDIGANDLLGHLASTDCSEDINNTPCLERINAALALYEVNIGRILDRIEAAMPDARVIILLTYNPFSFGFQDSVEFEAQSNAVLAQLNVFAAEAANARQMEVADGFTTMLNTAIATTHMADVPPDIHPNELGYDRLTKALVATL